MEDNSQRESKSVEFKCKACGGTMRFNIEKQTFCCENCGTESDVNDWGSVLEHDFQSAVDAVDPQWSSQTEVKACSSCGAQIVVEAGATTAKCAFCGSDLVLKERQLAGIRPEAIVPFKVDKFAAKSLFSKWLSRKVFAPRALKNLYQSGKLQAVYMPYWTFDADGFAHYTAEGGKVYYVTVGSGDKKHTERRVRWYHTSGTLDNFFDDVLVSATGETSQIQDDVSCFNTADCRPFALEYLSGFCAKKYDRSVNEAFPEAVKKMDRTFEQMARSEVLSRYDEVRGVNIHSSYMNIKFKQMLLPLWTSAYMFQNKLYNFMINGQTGKVSGEYPLSKIKVSIAIFVGLLILAALVYLYINNQ